MSNTTTGPVVARVATNIASDVEQEREFTSLVEALDYAVQQQRAGEHVDILLPWVEAQHPSSYVMMCLDSDETSYMEGTYNVEGTKS